MEELSSIRNAHNIVNSEVAEIFYAQAVSIVYFLMNKFEEYRFAILCKSLRENKSLDEALRRTYFNIRDTEDLYKQWLESLNR